MTHTLQEQAIDMVLTDYCMPEMTGYDLLKAIKVLLTQLLQDQSMQHFLYVVLFISAFLYLSYSLSRAGNYSY